MTLPFDRVAGTYDSTRDLPTETMTRIIESMQGVLSGCSTILDVGVGTGRFALPLGRKGFHVVGADISLLMMLKARQKGLKGVVRADARKLPFQDHTFDSVLIVHLLHLVDDWVKIVHEVGRVANLLILSPVSTSSGFRIRRDYLKLREDLGRPLKRLNKAEEGLRQLLPPKQVRPVGEFSSMVNSEEAIASLEKGDFAISWDLPPELHSRIIGKLRSKYDAKSYARTDKYELAVWTPKQFREFEPEM